MTALPGRYTPHHTPWPLLLACNSSPGNVVLCLSKIVLYTFHAFVERHLAACDQHLMSSSVLSCLHSFSEPCIRRYIFPCICSFVSHKCHIEQGPRCSTLSCNVPEICTFPQTGQNLLYVLMVILQQDQALTVCRLSLLSQRSLQMCAILACLAGTEEHLRRLSMLGCLRGCGQNELHIAGGALQPASNTG